MQIKFDLNDIAGHGPFFGGRALNSESTKKGGAEAPPARVTEATF